MNCVISFCCKLNVCKSNGWCIATKCSLSTRTEIKSFVDCDHAIAKQLKLLKIDNPPILFPQKSYITDAGIEFKSDPHECFYCGIKLYKTARTKDHVKPKCKGGKGSENIVWCCKPCNSDKGHLSLKKWLLKVQQRQNSKTKTSIINKLYSILT